jgi:hypothetical protein
VSHNDGRSIFTVSSFHWADRIWRSRRGLVCPAGRRRPVRPRAAERLSEGPERTHRLPAWPRRPHSSPSCDQRDGDIVVEGRGGGVEATGAGLRDQREDVGDATDRMRDISHGDCVCGEEAHPAGARTRGIAAARQADLASFCHTKIVSMFCSIHFFFVTCLPSISAGRGLRNNEIVHARRSYMRSMRTRDQSS